MCNAPDVLHDAPNATFKFEDDYTPLDVPRPATPLPDRSRTLQRTVSHASIDTIRPPGRKGVRRRIEDIAEDLKHKSAKKKKKRPSAQDVAKNAADDVASRSKASPESKRAKRGRKAAPPLRDSLHRPEEQAVMAIADRLHSGVPFNLDPPLTILGLKSDPLSDVPLFDDEEGIWEDRSLPVKVLQPGVQVAAERPDTNQSPLTTKVGIEDVRLHIRPSETDVTIWDGLRAAHHVFECRLFLRCTSHPYDSVAIPDIRLVEMDCNTRPVGSHYTRPPALQATYEGATPDQVASPGGPPHVNLAAGIHMEGVWCKTRDDDGTWGWRRHAFVPLSSRLFDKAEYREFKLVSRVWVGESCVEDELTFGISMLLRGVDMK